MPGRWFGSPYLTSFFMQTLPCSMPQRFACAGCFAKEGCRGQTYAIFVSSLYKQGSCVKVCCFALGVEIAKLFKGGQMEDDDTAAHEIFMWQRQWTHHTPKSLNAGNDGHCTSPTIENIVLAFTL
ncbi:unnamed protein product [Hapterophycus canaliculatus]